MNMYVLDRRAGKGDAAVIAQVAADQREVLDGRGQAIAGPAG